MIVYELKEDRLDWVKDHVLHFENLLDLAHIALGDLLLPLTYHLGHI